MQLGKNFVKSHKNLKIQAKGGIISSNSTNIIHIWEHCEKASPSALSQPRWIDTATTGTRHGENQFKIVLGYFKIRISNKAATIAHGNAQI